jgi:hypothetical protein
MYLLVVLFVSIASARFLAGERSRDLRRGYGTVEVL